MYNSMAKSSFAVSPITKAELFPFGSDAGDLMLAYGFDSVSPPLTLTTPFTFFGKQYMDIVVSFTT